MNPIGKLTLLSQYIVLVTCLLLYFINRSEKDKRFIKLLTLLSILTVIVESIGAYLVSIGKPNFIYHQFYIFFEPLIIFFMYKELINDKKWLNVSKIILLLCLVFWTLIFYDKHFFINSKIMGAINTGLLVFLYLKELLLSNKILNYKKNVSFWVSVGFIVFYLPSIPFFSMLSYMKNRDLFPILNVLVILMNIIISFGIIWSSKEVKY